MIINSLKIFLVSFILTELIIVSNSLIFRNNLTNKTNPFGRDIYLESKFNLIFLFFGTFCYLFIEKIKFLRTKKYIDKTMKNWKKYSERNYESVEEYAKSIGREKDLERFLLYQRKIKLKKLK